MDLQSIKQERQLYNERNDCTVFALAATTEIPYREAYSILADAGREPDKGMYFGIWLRNLHRLGPVTFGEYSVGKVQKFMSTLGFFAITHPRGRYIARIKGHVTPVIDGRILDSTLTHQTVWEAWEVTPKCN